MTLTLRLSGGWGFTGDSFRIPGPLEGEELRVGSGFFADKCISHRRAPDPAARDGEVSAQRNPEPAGCARRKWAGVSSFIKHPSPSAPRRRKQRCLNPKTPSRAVSPREMG